MTALMEQVHQLLRAALDARGLDARLCYTHVTALPPDGATVLVETSNAEVTAAVERGLDADALARLRLRTLPDPADTLPDGVIAVNSVVDVRREASHASELRTQIIYGDAITPLKREGDWMLVRLEDDYIGWIRTWHLEALTPQAQEAYARAARDRVALNHADVLSAPEAGATPVTDLVAGTAVVTVDGARRGWRRIELPDGRGGFVTSRALEPIPANSRVTAAALARTALGFSGIPYLWGGTTPKGFDCSGLIQRVFRLHGRRLPRDADMQFLSGRRLSARRPSDLDPGDLLFFGRDESHITHVGMLLPDGTLIHAYGRVRVGSLDPDHPLFEPVLAPIWRGATAPPGPARKR